METAWQVTHAVDALQTLQIARDPCFEEQDAITRRLIGRNPSEAQVIAWWAGTAMLHAWVSNSLEPWPKWQTVWQSVTLVNSMYFIAHNHREGIRIGSSC